MNTFFWTLQVVLALHTVMGAVWKFSHAPAQTMPSLGAIPSGAWLALSGIELLCAAALVLPAVSKPLALLAPLAALFIASEMLLFCGVHLTSGSTNYGPMGYWLAVAAVCAFLAYGRIALRPF